MRLGLFILALGLSVIVAAGPAMARDCEGIYEPEDYRKLASAAYAADLDGMCVEVEAQLLGEWTIISAYQSAGIDVADRVFIAHRNVRYEGGGELERQSYPPFPMSVRRSRDDFVYDWPSGTTFLARGLISVGDGYGKPYTHLRVDSVRRLGRATRPGGSTSASSPSLTPEKVEQLKLLKELLDSGIVDDLEFKQRRDAILDGSSGRTDAQPRHSRQESSFDDGADVYEDGFEDAEYEEEVDGDYDEFDEAPEERRRSVDEPEELTDADLDFRGKSDRDAQIAKGARSYSLAAGLIAAPVLWGIGFVGTIAGNVALADDPGSKSALGAPTALLMIGSGVGFSASLVGHAGSKKVGGPNSVGFACIGFGTAMAGNAMVAAALADFEANSSGFGLSEDTLSLHRILTALGLGLGLVGNLLNVSSSSTSVRGIAAKLRVSVQLSGGGASVALVW